MCGRGDGSGGGMVDEVEGEGEEGKGDVGMVVMEEG